MSLTIRPKLKCPHCGTDNATLLTVDSVIMNRFFIRCDVEIGGCDELFAIEVNMKTDVTVWKLQPAMEAIQGGCGMSKETYTDIFGDVIEVESLLWLEDSRYYDEDEGEYRDCSRYCTNSEEVDADGESVWLNEDFVEVDPDASPEEDDDMEEEEE